MRKISFDSAAIYLLVFLSVFCMLSGLLQQHRMREAQEMSEMRIELLEDDVANITSAMSAAHVAK